MRVVRWGSAFALVLVPALARGVDPAPPVPPALPGAAADANGVIAVIAQDGGGIAAVDLSTGQTRWRSARGRWPLASAYPWVAVAAPDDADGRVLRVRFLRPADGSLLVDAKPIRLPTAIGTEASWEGEGLSLGTGNTSVHVTAWVPGPQRRPSRDPRAGRLRIRWKTESFIGGGGMRPPERGPTFSGLAFVDPASGAAGWYASTGRRGRFAGPTPCRRVFCHLRWPAPARGSRADVTGLVEGRATPESRG